MEFRELVIGTGVVVTKDVPDCAVVVGKPAKVIKYRFSQETIHKIKSSQCWTKDIEELKENLEEYLKPVQENSGNEV